MKKKFKDLKYRDVIVLPAVEEEDWPEMTVRVNKVFELKDDDWFLSYDDINILQTGEYGECPVNPDDEVDVIS